MQVKCAWDISTAPSRCAVPDCPKEAHLFCHDHLEEGYFCSRHRSTHTRRVAKRNAELDSRPREAEPAERLAQSLVDLSAAVTNKLMPEVVRLV